MEQYQDQALVRELLATERTFLAWLRTGIGIMAFGFVVVKFSLFVRQVANGLDTPIQMHQQGYSGIIGIGLVFLGAIMCGFSYIRYRQTILQIQNRKFTYNSFPLSVLAIIILIISVMLIGYLIQSI